MGSRCSQGSCHRNFKVNLVVQHKSEIQDSYCNHPVKTEKPVTNLTIIWRLPSAASEPDAKIDSLFDLNCSLWFVKLYLLSCRNNKVRSDLNNLVVVAAINCQIKDKGAPLQILVNQDLDGKYLPRSRNMMMKRRRRGRRRDFWAKLFSSPLYNIHHTWYEVWYALSKTFLWNKYEI